MELPGAGIPVRARQGRGVRRAVRIRTESLVLVLGPALNLPPRQNLGAPGGHTFHQKFSGLPTRWPEAHILETLRKEVAR